MHDGPATTEGLMIQYGLDEANGVHVPIDEEANNEGDKLIYRKN